MAVEDEKKETQKEGNDTRQGRRWSNAGRRETTIEGTKGGGAGGRALRGSPGPVQL